MYIREIHIENIRGFGEGDEGAHLVDLGRPGWTVVAGRNGSGKTTLLKAIALAVAGPITARQLQQSFVGWVHKTGSVPLDRSGRVGVLLEQDARDVLLPADKECTPRFAELIWSELPWSEDHLRADLRGGQEPRLTSGARSDGLERGRGPWSLQPSGWDIAAYGPYRRISGAGRSLREEPYTVSRLAPLFADDATLIEGIRWIREQHALRLDLAARAERDEKDGRPDEAQQKRNLESVLNNMIDYLLEMLNDDLLPDGHRVVDINMDGVWIERGGVKLALLDLGEGYKSVIALIIDIARHIYTETVDEYSRDGEGVRPARGVVLIDEMEAHLHVSWQQKIGFWLKRRFPSTQFIVTTHSPFICQAADEIIRVAPPGAGVPVAERAPEEIYNRVVNGGADDAVMTALFGLERPYSPPAEALRRRVTELEAKLLRTRITPGEEAELGALKQKLPSAGSAMVEVALRALKAAE